MSIYIYIYIYICVFGKCLLLVFAAGRPLSLAPRQSAAEYFDKANIYPK